MKPFALMVVVSLPLALAACSGIAGRSGHAAVVVPPDAGTVRWWMPETAAEVGDGGVFNVKVDRISVPYANLMVASQATAADGIPVHLHVSEEEVLYVVSGTGAAIVGDDRREIPVEPGTVIYVPVGEWHGLRNADPDDRMDVLVVTTPVEKNGLGEFFRNVGTKPGHPPLNIPPEEFRALFRQYGMELPDD